MKLIAVLPPMVLPRFQGTLRLLASGCGTYVGEGERHAYNCEVGTAQA